jgi:thymidine kinase
MGEQENSRHEARGRVEVICGSMFSGKTEELLRRLRRATIARFRVGLYKPLLDTRFDTEQVVSHNAMTASAIPIRNASELLDLAQRVEVVGIDEAQFLDNGLTEVCKQLANHGKRVIVAGLDMDYLGNPFGVMPLLMAIAEEVTKVQAVCMQCGMPALFSYRLTNQSAQVMLGSGGDYEPRCRVCYLKGAELRSDYHDLFHLDS